MSSLINPSLHDVRDEFGVATANALPNDRSMRSMYAQVFSGGTSGGRLSDFDGTGKPVGTVTVGQDCAVGSFRPVFNGNISDDGGLTVNYRFKYDTDPLFPNPSFTAAQTTTGTGPVTDQPNSYDFNDGQTVYAVIQVWNTYNDEAASDYEESATDNITFSGTGISVPAVNSFEVQGDGDVIFDFDYSDLANSFDIEIQKDDNGTWVAEGVALESSTNWGTSTNPKTGTWQLDALPNPGDSYRARIKAEAPNACYSDSGFTSYYNDTV